MDVCVGACGSLCVCVCVLVCVWHDVCSVLCVCICDRVCCVICWVLVVGSCAFTTPLQNRSDDHDDTLAKHRIDPYAWE